MDGVKWGYVSHKDDISVCFLRLRFEGMLGIQRNGGDQIAKYFEDESVGLACKYLPVVATDECPKVLWTKWIGAPLSRACDPWQCLNQCGLTGFESSARWAALRTIRRICDGCKCPPLRLLKIGSLTSVFFRNEKIAEETESGSKIDRVWPPFPRTVIWHPSCLAWTSLHFKPHNSETRTADPYRSRSRAWFRGSASRAIIRCTSLSSRIR